MTNGYVKGPKMPYLKMTLLGRTYTPTGRDPIENLSLQVASRIR